MRVLGDIPLLGWTVEAIQQSKLRNSKYLLSTDDNKIAEVAREFGINVPFRRPDVLATDEASAESVSLHALHWVEQQGGLKPKYLMWLQPTSPFRPPESLIKAYSMIVNSSADAVVGVKALHRTPRTIFNIDKNYNLIPLDEKSRLATRRQDINTCYTPNGAMYIVRVDVLKEQRTFYPRQCRAIIMDPISSHDIDTPEDWFLAEALVSAGLTWRQSK